MNRKGKATDLHKTLAASCHYCTRPQGKPIRNSTFDVTSTVLGQFTQFTQTITNKQEVMPPFLVAPVLKWGCRFGKRSKAAGPWTRTARPYFDRKVMYMVRRHSATSSATPPTHTVAPRVKIKTACNQRYQPKYSVRFDMSLKRLSGSSLLRLKQRGESQTAQQK